MWLDTLKPSRKLSLVCRTSPVSGPAVVPVLPGRLGFSALKVIRSVVGILCSYTER